MTSHYRHRRISDPATAFPSPIEPGEIAVNTANRQIAVGDADPASPGATKPLLAVRVFDTKAQYAVGDHGTSGSGGGGAGGANGTGGAGGNAPDYSGGGGGGGGGGSGAYQVGAANGGAGGYYGGGGGGGGQYFGLQALGNWGMSGLIVIGYGP